jgi:ESS family glutamate:Na+ symporter
MKRKGRLNLAHKKDELNEEVIENENEIPMQESIDKMTVQIALVLLAYLMTYALMALLTKLIGMQSVIYGFNFLFGVLMASVIKLVAKFSHKKGIIKKYHRNNFLLDRISNTCFDVMVVAGIAAIRFDVLGNYWLVLIILGVVGALITYFYNRFIARKFFADYAEEQFLMMYGMLTGTASTGMILLREADEGFKTPVADNLVYQNFPAMVFGFPLMLLANLAPKEPWLTFAILVAFLLVMNIILFRSYIFKRKSKHLNAQK